MNGKICVKCGEQLVGRQSKFCNECRILGKRDAANKYSAKNREKIRQYGKEYEKTNKTKIKDRKAKYLLNNKEKLKKKRREKAKNKRKNCIEFKLKANVSRAVRHILSRTNGSKKGESLLKYVDWSVEELKKHLENQFENWMNWENWGKYDPKTWNDNDSNTWKWEIDHIKPQSTLKFASLNDDNFKECWNLENLRPLNAKQNFLDGIYKIRHNKGIK